MNKKDEIFLYWQNESQLNKTIILILGASFVIALILIPIIILPTYLTIVLAGFGFFVLILKIPKWQVTHLEELKVVKHTSKFDREKDITKLRDDTRKTTIQIFGGIFFVFGLIVTYNTFKLNSTGQASERYIKALELIKTEDLPTRIGGLYLCEIIAKESPANHSPIMKVLNIFIREKSRKQREDEIHKQRLNNPTFDLKQAKFNAKSPDDVSIAVSIIVNRDRSNDEKDLKFDFSRTNLFESVFTKTSLEETNFTDADLGKSRFDHAFLNYALFTGANLTQTNFSHADLSDANFENATLDNTKFTKANLSGARFSVVDFSKSDFTGAIMDRVDFGSADFGGITVPFEYIREADLSKVKNLKCEQLRKVFFDDKSEQLRNIVFDDKTKFPKELTECSHKLLNEINAEFQNRKF